VTQDTATDTRVAGGRNLALDGVRGLAALSVALGHCVLMVAGLEVWEKTASDFPAMTPEQFIERVLFLLFPSNAAVMVFFVLSGHVLWASFARKRAGIADAPDYVLARAFRLLPLVIATTILFLLVVRPPLAEVLANMVLLSTSMNNVLWSLQVEMVGSLVIFIVWLAARNDPIRLIAALVVVAAAVPFFRGNHLVVYLPAFVLGALTHHMPERVWRSRAVLAAALALLLLPSLAFGYRGVTRVFEIVAATAIVGCVSVQRPAWLEAAPVKFLGAVSYPFYLTHPLGVAGAVALAGTLPDANFLARFAIYALLSIGIAMPIAWLLHVAVEMPALRLRPRLSRKPPGAPPPM
jgi:peptidoglycan/LPS O-acetylase OafA/YrhL